MKRDAAGSLQLELQAGDSIQHTWGTSDGLIAISKRRTFRIRTPDCIDPDRKYADAPWQQSILFECGTESPLVARSVVQVQTFLEQMFAQGDRRRHAVFDTSLSVTKSLLSLERIVIRLRQEVRDREELVSGAIEQYTTGQAPRPIKPILTLEDDFKAFALEVRQCLNHTSGLFGPLMGEAIEPGRFDVAREKLTQRIGADAILVKMLEGDARWIEAWIVVANTLKHPNKGERVVVNDMRLLPSRQIQLPTWQLFHPKLDLTEPQDLLGAAEIVISNLLGLFENLFVELVQQALPSLPKGFQWAIEDIPEQHRNCSSPARYALSVFAVDPD